MVWHQTRLTLPARSLTMRVFVRSSTVMDPRGESISRDRAIAKFRRRVPLGEGCVAVKQHRGATATGAGRRL